MKDLNLKILMVYVSGIITFIFGEWDMALKGLICFMILDYITGVMSGIYLKEISSKRGFRGIVKKVLLLMVIAVATVGDEIIGSKGLARGTIIYFFMATEAISILENCIKCGVEVPKWLVDKLEYFKNKKLEKRD